MEIMEIDLLREPRLREFAVQYNREGQDAENPMERAYLLPSPCPFYKNNSCGIYKTRPNICVAFSDKCLGKEREGYG